VRVSVGEGVEVVGLAGPSLSKLLRMSLMGIEFLPKSLKSP